MILHIFNPEHDLALANNDKNFTAPHAARQLRSDLGFLPAFWANDGDAVLVDNVQKSKVALTSFKDVVAEIELVDSTTLGSLQSRLAAIRPWGWDKAIVFQLSLMGIDTSLMPNELEIMEIRRLSSRALGLSVLHKLRQEIAPNHTITGTAYCVKTLSELEAIAAQHSASVVKAMWSSSGRGIRYVNRQIDKVQLNWAQNIINKQGSIMIEPFYEKVLDFAMEFSFQKDSTEYLGLSLFRTTHGVYEGNLLASETHKRQILSEYVSLSLLDEVQELLKTLLTNQLIGKYSGYLGVDMMVVSDPLKGYLLHPVVEINLRQTMGHVCLALTQKLPDVIGSMSIDFDGSSYCFSIERI